MNTDNTTISILHAALEGGNAVFGGLGRVAMQMLDAQNTFVENNARKMHSNIITPYYPSLHTNYTDMQEIASINHLYDNCEVTSKIFAVKDKDYLHYLIVPDPRFANMFNIKTLPELYLDTEYSFFIERIKYFNSCVAAFIANQQHLQTIPNVDVVHLHDWQAALIPKLLKEYYNNKKVKSVFTVHIDAGDRGTFPSQYLEGIGLQFGNAKTILKALGIIYSDKIVGVSPKFMHECIHTVTDDIEAEYVRKTFAIANAQNKTIGISNGINYKDYCPLGKHIQDPTNILAEKKRLKQEIANELCSKRLVWNFDPNLPLILYVGRYSPEKGDEVFKQIIEDTNGRAAFVAVGRGMTDSTLNAIVTHSRQTDNVFITASEEEQANLLAKLRAAADIVVIPSHRDAFGLVGPEALANGSIIVTTGVGGLKDVVTPLDTDNNCQIGNGIFYEDQPYGGHNPDLSVALTRALDIWGNLSSIQINNMQSRIINEAKKFDWNSKNGSVDKYLQVYNDLLYAQNIYSKEFNRFHM